jgi:hypothetical protein
MPLRNNAGTCCVNSNKKLKHLFDIVCEIAYHCSAFMVLAVNSAAAKAVFGALKSAFLPVSIAPVRRTI